MSYNKCCVPGCSITEGSDNILHEFPNPAKDIDRFMTWIHSIGGDILKLTNKFIHKNRRVCRLHFEEKYHCRFNRLSNIAVPTINMPDLNTSVLVEQTPFCQLQNLLENMPLVSSASTDHTYAISTEEPLRNIQSWPMNRPSSSTKSDNLPIEPVTMQHHILSQEKENIGLTVHNFPNPSKFPERFRIWVKLGGEQLKNLSVEEIYGRVKVCDKHFIDSHRNRNSRLNAMAVPTLHLPQSQPGQNVCKASERDPLDNTKFQIDMPVLTLDQDNNLNNTEHIDIVYADENIQEEVEIEMNVSANTEERSKLSRDGHNKNLKRLNTSSRAGAKTSIPWRYEKQVENNLVRCESTEYDSNSNSTLNTLSNSDEDVYTINYMQASTSAMFAEVTKRKDVDQKYEEEKYLDNHGHETLKPSNSNAVHSFFKAMADTVVTLPPDVQLKIKNQLYAAVSQAEYELQQRRDVSVSSSEGDISCDSYHPRGKDVPPSNLAFRYDDAV